MKDLLGEKTALDQTRLIMAGVDPKSLSLKLRNILVQTVLENQLKNFTNYNRFQRRKTVRELLKGKK